MVKCSYIKCQLLRKIKSPHHLNYVNLNKSYKYKMEFILLKSILSLNLKIHISAQWFFYTAQ